MLLFGDSLFAIPLTVTLPSLIPYLNNVCFPFVFVVCNSKTYYYDLADLSDFHVVGAQFFLSMDIRNSAYSVECSVLNFWNVYCESTNTHGRELSNVRGQNCFEFSADNWFQHPQVNTNKKLAVTVSNGHSGIPCNRHVHVPFLLIMSNPRNGNSACPTMPGLRRLNNTPTLQHT